MKRFETVDSRAAFCVATLAGKGPGGARRRAFRRGLLLSSALISALSLAAPASHAEPLPANPYWNGAVDQPGGAEVVGGAGTWNAANTNWTDAAGATAGTWDGALAIFAGTGGAVSVAGAPGVISVTGMQFDVDGYALSGDSITLAAISGQTGISVATDASATIGSALIGTTGLEKIGDGTLVLSGNNTYSGGTTASAGTLEFTGNNTLGGDMVASNGSLIFSGGTSTAQAPIIGSDAGTSGSLTVTGESTSLALSSEQGVLVGNYGTGTMTISDGATVTAIRVSLGSEVGGDGTATVTGAGSNLTLQEGLVVGSDGAGTLTISDGGAASAVFVAVGSGDGSSGSLTVTGEDSTVTSSGGVTVGGSGVGAMTISHGGSVTGTYGVIGQYATVMSTATVTGAGSSWTNSGSLTIGANTGAKGTLTVAAGGKVSSTSAALGSYRGSQGIVTVTGAGSTLDLAGGSFTVGVAGEGIVTVAAGGTVLSGYVTMALSEYGTGAITVTGAGSLWDAGTNSVSMGSYGTNASITVEDGGTMAASSFYQDYSPGTRSITLDGGTLRATATQSYFLSGFDAGDVTLAAGGGTIDSNGFDIGADSVLGGEGALTKTGTGTLTLTGANTYTGGTVISGGTLQIGNGRAAGSILGDVTNNSVLAFNRSDAFTMAGAISGTGAVVQAGSGTLYLTGANTYSGGTTITTGTLRVDTANALGSGGLTVGEAGTFRASGTFDFGGAVVLDGTASTAGTFEVDASQALTLSGVISGESGLTKTGDGLLILTATNTFTGVTTISDGTLQIGDGGTTGSLAGEVVNNASLVFDRSGTYAFTDAVTGNGTVSFTGGGTVLFSASYGGTISVDDANVQLASGSTNSSAFTLNEGGVLGGTATIGALTVNSGGTVAPGTSPGTLTVNGPVAFNAGSTYEVDITADGAHDLITATGAVTLSPDAGVEVVATPGNYSSMGTITILSTSSTLTGTFGPATSDFAFLTPELTYDAQNVFLTLVSNGKNFVDYARTPNQAGVAVAAQALGGGNTLYEAIFSLPEGAVAPAFNQLTGEVYTSARTVIQQQSIYLRDAVGSRLRQSLTAPSAGALSYAAKAAGPASAQLGQGFTPTLWAQGFGGWGETSGNANAASVSNTVGGVFGGVDVAVLDNVRVGLIGGYSRTSFDVDARSSSGSMDNYDIGLYAGAQFDAVALRGGASYTWHDISASRSVFFPGYYGANDADYTVGTTQLFGEIGYDMSVGAYAFEPFVGLAYVNISGDRFTESGTIASALSVDAPSQGTFYSTLGIRAATSFTVAGRTLTTSATLGWQHAFGDTDASATMLFANGGTTPFGVQGVPIAEDVALVGVGLGYQLSESAELQFNYAGQLAGEANQNTFSAQFSLSF
ncbi:outer membrane autotransporter protein [Ancylobacter aquaticus]|uniref:Outer membrane autotransporter protein n=1 Tax=Ancylobacter aquaticus TaxID=100 RepID=A0A4R1I502_ANCAQ|nr:autotransporter domain-containing protein [Ancylobacter aquaticus]TCK30414.1 outer membrane autotransporter protein [Ancylobacter aquaticus]